MPYLGCKDYLNKQANKQSKQSKKKIQKTYLTKIKKNTKSNHDMLIMNCHFIQKQINLILGVKLTSYMLLKQLEAFINEDYWMY